MSDQAKDSESIRALCATLYREPQRITQVSRLPVVHPIVLESHAHRHLLQLDLTVGCEGGWHTPAGLVSAEGVSAATFYPRQQHGYELRPRRHKAEMFSLKIRVPEGWPGQNRPFPALVRHTLARVLLNSARRLKRLSESASACEPARIVAMSEILAAWPRTTEQPRGSEAFAPVEAIDKQLAPVVHDLEQGQGPAPSLEELARKVHLSPRQLTRRFWVIFGCTPHEYAERRRLDHARALLVQTDSPLAGMAHELGFSSEHHFSRWFRARTGQPPGRFRRTGLML